MQRNMAVDCPATTMVFKRREIFDPIPRIQIGYFAIRGAVGTDLGLVDVTADHVGKSFLDGQFCCEPFKVCDETYGRFHAVFDAFGQRDAFATEGDEHGIDRAVDADEDVVSHTAQSG